MSTQLQIRRGSTNEHNGVIGNPALPGFTGAQGEVTVDIDKHVTVIHDGNTVGGHPSVSAKTLATEDGAGLIGINDAGGLYAATTVEAALQEVKTDLSASGGSDLVGYLPAGTGASTDRSVQDKLRESVSVLDYEHLVVGGDWTAAFNAAINTGAGEIYVPGRVTSYVVGDFNVLEGTRLVGPGKLKYTGFMNSGTELSLNINNPSWPMRVMWALGNVSYGFLLEIKNLGANTIMWGDNTTIGTEHANLINNIESLGMKIILVSGYDTLEQHIINAVARDCVYGLYLFDEPLGKLSATKEIQESRIALYRTITDKPLVITATGIFGYDAMRSVVSPLWDIIFIDNYFDPDNLDYGPDADTSNKSIALNFYSQIKYAAPNTTLIPMVGLFQDGVFSNKSKSIAFAKDFARTSEEGHISIFSYGASVAGGFAGDTADDADFRAAVPLVWNAAQNIKRKIKIEDYIFEQNEIMGALLELYDKNTSGEDIYPWTIKQIPGSGSIRKQPLFGMTGLAIRNTGGNVGFRKPSMGNVTVYLRYVSVIGVPDTASIGIISSTGDMYEDLVVEPYATSLTYYQVVDVPTAGGYRACVNIRKGLTVGLKFTTAYSYEFPFRVLNGGVIYSNWDTVEFI